MPPLTKFASAEYPLHASQTPELMACPWKSVMKFVEQAARTSGQAADTGSAMHKAASLFHKGKGVDEAIAEMRSLSAEYPMADLIEAARLFRVYARDPRNSEAKVPYVEYHLTAGQVDCQTGETFVFEGTIDQIREGEKGWEIWDIKTSQSPGPKIRDEHTYQLAVYAFMASKHFKREVLPGGVILPRGYRVNDGLCYMSPDKVFYNYSITREQVKRLIDNVIARVRSIRRGHIEAVPGSFCEYCIGIKNCLPKLDNFYSRGECPNG